MKYITPENLIRIGFKETLNDGVIFYRRQRNDVYFLPAIHGKFDEGTSFTTLGDEIKLLG